MTTKQPTITFRVIIGASKLLTKSGKDIEEASKLIEGPIYSLMKNLVVLSDDYRDVKENFRKASESKVDVGGILADFLKTLGGKEGIAKKALETVQTSKVITQILTIVARQYEEGMKTLVRVSNLPINANLAFYDMLYSISSANTIKDTAMKVIDSGKVITTVFIEAASNYAKAIGIIGNTNKANPNAPEYFTRILTSIANGERVIDKSLIAIMKANILMNTFTGVAQRYEIGTNYFGRVKKSGVNPEEMLVSFARGLNATGDTFNTKMSKKQLDSFTTFNNQILRLTGAVSPFERFVKSFGDMAKNMKVFADNFNVMDTDGIKAFKDWTDSMVNISKVDITKSGGIIDFVNKTVSAAFPAGGSSKVAAGKSPQEYTQSDKKAQVAAQVGKGGGMGAGTQQQPALAPVIKIDTAALANAISSALRNISVDTIKVNKLERI